MEQQAPATSTYGRPLDRCSAEHLDARIRALSTRRAADGAILEELLDEARAGQIHHALGFRSWTAYVADALSKESELDATIRRRRSQVATMTGAGMSQRAIADALGISQATVSRDQQMIHGESPNALTGLDGKTYPRRKPPREPDHNAPLAGDGEPVPIAVWDQRRREWVTDRTDGSGRAATFAASWPPHGVVRNGVLLVGADYARRQHITEIGGWRGEAGRTLGVELALRSAERAVEGLAAATAGHEGEAREETQGRLGDLRDRVDGVIAALTTPVNIDG